jgi:hypothetical protein
MEDLVLAVTHKRLDFSQETGKCTVTARCKLAEFLDTNPRN